MAAVFRVRRLGVVLEPDPANPDEVEGVLNPGGVLGPDGRYHLFPRLVARGNYSRIGHVVLDGPCMRRLGVALEPCYEWEARGVEDPRVVYRAEGNVYVMTYTALGADNKARVAWAFSRDLLRWTDRTLVRFKDHPLPISPYANKDALLWPEPVLDPAGRPADALLHRPLVPNALPSMWLSYRPVGSAPDEPFSQHTLLYAPRYSWERARVGAGPPPLRCAGGWLLLYHGMTHDPAGRRRYSAGLLLLDAQRPHRVHAGSPRPFLVPRTPDERVALPDVPTAVGNVVFPTALEERADGLRLYYGAADSRICAAHLAPRAA